MDDVGTGQLDFSIVSPKLTIEAMRDSGYKDTDHAIAELIDNSIEAKAKLEAPKKTSKILARLGGQAREPLNP